MGAEKAKHIYELTEAARLKISQETFELIKEFFAQTSIPRIAEKRKKERGTSAGDVREDGRGQSTN